MTLEDFFTLTEMKDGLTALSRVEELIAVMRKEKDDDIKNSGDATRQWAAVASTIASTESRDCLDLFVRLDGLQFFNRWLKDAQNLEHDTGDSLVQETITALLRALEKLQIDNGRLVSSGIWVTVKSLLDHSSSTIQDRARQLFDDWKCNTNCDALHSADNVGADHNDEGTANPELAKQSGKLEEEALSGKSYEKEIREVQSARDEILQPKSFDNLRPDRIVDVQAKINDEKFSSCEMDYTDNKDKTLAVLTSGVATPLQENMCPKEESAICTVQGTALVDSCDSASPNRGSVEDKPKAPKLNDSHNDEKPASSLQSPVDYLGKREFLSGGCTVQSTPVSSSANVSRASELGAEVVAESNSHHTEGGCSLRTTASGDLTPPSNEPHGGLENRGVINHCSTQVVQTVDEGDQLTSKGSLVLSDNACVSERCEAVESFSRMGVAGDVEENEQHSSERDDGNNLKKASCLVKPALGARFFNSSDKRSDMELDYGLVDALEVARQVAQEVEREVVDDREPSCSSSSGKKLGGRTKEIDSPGSIKEKQEQSTVVSPEEVHSDQSHSVEVSSEEKTLKVAEQGTVVNYDGLEAKQDNDTHDMESSPVIETAQEPEPNLEKGACGFDLNEVCADDVLHSTMTDNHPLPVVSASRPPAASALPVAPLQFEGTLGWKGSAATSAFRPASPRKVPDGDKISSMGATSTSSKQRQDTLNFDLNVAEGADDRVADHVSGGGIPISSGLHFEESPAKLNLRKPERLNLDLNQISQDGDTTSNLMTEGRVLHPHNGRQSPSPASSSSSMQPLVRNIDLNDWPSIHNDSAAQRSNLGIPLQSGSEESVILIMGAKVEVNRKDFAQSPSLPNGRALATPMDASLTRAGGFWGMGSTVSYPHSSALGHNGTATGPTLSFSSSMYGTGSTVPYMDMRGAPVVPQIVGSASVFPRSQPPFMMTMTGQGPSQPTLDLNSGFVVDAGGKETGGLRHLFIPDQAKSTGEHLRATSQACLISEVGGKRKEPDTGLDPYPYGYKHQQPPWK